MKRLFVTLAIAAALGGCGNYSNGDIDFQYALPERGDIAMKAAALSAAPGLDKAEYYTSTRNTVRGFDALVDLFTALIDAVRAVPPTERNGEARVWGPFPEKKDPAWLVRISAVRVLDTTRDPAELRFDYQVEYRHARRADMPWGLLLKGFFYPLSGGARRGRGELTLDLRQARADGYPVSDFNELAVLTIKHQRSQFPITIAVDVQNVPDSKTPHYTYDYTENADGSGAMAFVVHPADIRWQSIEIKSRWLGTGAGRGDARVTEGLLTIVTDPTGTDCWGPDGRATYVRRGWDPTKTTGDPATCIP
jgi:hypothetical protein